MSDEGAGLLIRTGIENTTDFLSLFESEQCDPEKVLHRDSTLTARDCYMNEAAQYLWLEFRYDIDGIVSTFDNFSSIKCHFSYLNILPRNFDSLIPVFSTVRKHFSLKDYSNIGLQYLKWSVGIKLFDADGFEFQLVLLPVRGRHHFKIYSKKELVDLQYKYFLNFRNSFSCVIQSLPVNDLSRATIKKNRIFNVQKWFVLPDDRKLILSCLDKALSKTAIEKSFERKIIAFSFGQRNSSPYVRIEAFDTSDALVTVHAAVTISSPVLEQHLFWSRFGIQDLIGERGTLYSALSLTSCCNFQTNLDGRCIDISPELRLLCRIPENLRFLQFYCDTPHLDTNYIHPVFGTIISCGVLHTNITQSLRKKGSEYISLLKENLFKLQRVNARFELVCVAENANSEIISPQNYINGEHLRYLLGSHPLIVPFNDQISSSCRETFLDVIKRIPQYLVNVLENLFEKFGDKGGLLNAWRSYQCELAAEIFWKGRPHAYIDNLYGNNLGPGGMFPERSKTWEKGFLCFEDCLSCAVGESSIPPLIFYPLRKADKEKIRRIFSFVDFLNGSDTVIGVRLALVLLNDFLSDPKREAYCDRSFISDLKQDTYPTWARLTGCIDISSLAEKVCVQKLYKHPYVFGRALELILGAGRDPIAIFGIGVRHLKLNYFPDVRFVDSSRHMKISWPSSGVLKLFRGDNTRVNNKLELKTANFTRDIIVYLEEQGLVFQSKFATYFEKDLRFALPWLYDVLAKLGTDYLAKDDFVVLLSYVSCVGLLQNNWYVDLKKFKQFHVEFYNKNPEILQELLSCEVFSVFRLRTNLNIRIHRLHESIPHLLPTEPLQQQKVLKQQTQKEDDIEETNEPTEELENAECLTDDVAIGRNDHEDVTKGMRLHYPSGLKSRWSSVELEVLYTLMNQKFKTNSTAYTAYKKECLIRNIPSRTIMSFRRKFGRMSEKKH